MSIPAFSAQASLYSNSRRYRSSITESDAKSSSGHSIVPAYMPGPATQHECALCTDACAVPRDVCLSKVAISVAEGCIASLGFGCGAAISLGYLQAASCLATYAVCLDYCNIPDLGVTGFHGPCCPKVCSWPDLIAGFGSGCCDHGEACVDKDDPNSREGCCPTEQAVCGGDCCAKGEYCCGENCCPADYFCRDGVSCSQFPGDFNPGTPPPPPPADNCIFGGEPCGPKCCPPGTHCCNYHPETGADCRTSCWA